MYIHYFIFNQCPQIFHKDSSVKCKETDHDWQVNALVTYVTMLFSQCSCKDSLVSYSEKQWSIIVDWYVYGYIFCSVYTFQTFVYCSVSLVSYKQTHFTDSHGHTFYNHLYSIVCICINFMTSCLVDYFIQNSNTITINFATQGFTYFGTCRNRLLVYVERQWRR